MKRLTAICLILIMVLSGCGGPPSREDVLDGIDTFILEAGGLSEDDDLTEANWYRAGDGMTDWLVIMTARQGKDFNRERYLADLNAHVTAAYQTEQQLDKVKSTEWHRIAMVYLLLGEDPPGSLDLVAEGTYNWTHTDELDLQGSNALIYALMVINASGVTVPEDALYPEDTIVNMLLAYQRSDGGFALANGGSDTDITAMALQALAFYKDDTSERTLEDGRTVSVAEAIDAGLAYLSEVQSPGGYYRFGGVFSSDTLSQVILALAALGIDPAKDERFRKAGAGPEDALMTFRNKDGGFASVLDSSGDPEESDLLATRQAGCALIALTLLEQTGSGIFFDFSNRLSQ